MAFSNVREISAYLKAVSVCQTLCYLPSYLHKPKKYDTPFFLFDSLFFYCLKRKMYGKFMVVLSQWWCHLFILAPWIWKYAIFDCEKRIQLTEALYCAACKTKRKTDIYIYLNLFFSFQKHENGTQFFILYNAHTFSPV